MSVLELKNVSIRYMTGDFKDIGLKEYVVRRIRNNYHVKEFWADRHVSFSLEKGDMLGIIGTNGAGKSTLLKAISGIMEPTEGWITRTGNIAALLELGSGFDGDLTVKENTYLRGAMLGYTRKFMDETYRSIIDFAELQDFEDRPFKQLSSGMKSRLAFSIASLVRPDILILDEVLSVGDGSFKKKSEEKMQDIIGSGATTILVSHSIGQVKEMCNKVLWLHKGEQVLFGSDVERICGQYKNFVDNKVWNATVSQVTAKDIQEHLELLTPPEQDVAQEAGASIGSSGFNWNFADDRVSKMLREEKKFADKKEIGYLLDRVSWNCPYLVVSFAGFNSLHLEQHPYNYLKALTPLNIHQLYIQDTCGERGCYYLCNHFDFSIEETVEKLIETVRTELQVEKKNVILIGSSKGGSAALYFGTKYGYGHVIAGVPQSRIGTYLMNIPKEIAGPVLEYMLDCDGEGKPDSKQIEALDQLIFSRVDNCSENTQVQLIVSETDGSWPTQLEPLVNRVKDKKNFQIICDKRVLKHSDIGKYFPEHLRTEILKIMGYETAIPENYTDDGSKLVVHYPQNAVGQRCTLLQNMKSDRINRAEDQDNVIYDFQNLGLNPVKFQLNELVTAKIGNQKINLYNAPGFKGVVPSAAMGDITIECYQVQNEMKIQIHSQTEIELEYACYLYLNGKIKESFWYSDKTEYSIPIEESGEYAARYFVRLKEDQGEPIQNGMSALVKVKIL